MTFTVNDGSAGQQPRHRPRGHRSSPVNDAPDAQPDPRPVPILENAGPQTITLTGITAGAGESRDLDRHRPTSSNTGLIPNPRSATSAPTPRARSPTPRCPTPSARRRSPSRVTDNGGTGQRRHQHLLADLHRDGHARSTTRPRSTRSPTPPRSSRTPAADGQPDGHHRRRRRARRTLTVTRRQQQPGADPQPGGHLHQPQRHRHAHLHAGAQRHRHGDDHRHRDRQRRHRQRRRQHFTQTFTVTVTPVNERPRSTRSPPRPITRETPRPQTST